MIAVGTLIAERPPAQIRTCGFPAYGSHLGSMAASATAAIGRSPYVAPILCPARIRRSITFPSVLALRSTSSAASHLALFAGFIATMARSDFSRPCIVGYGSSPSRRGPLRHKGQPARRETSQVPMQSFRA